MKTIDPAPFGLRFSGLASLFVLFVLAGCTQADEVSTPRTFDFDPLGMQLIDISEATILVLTDKFPEYFLQPVTDIPIQLRLDDPANPGFISLKLVSELVETQTLFEQQVVVTELNLDLPRNSLEQESFTPGPGSYVELGVYPGSGQIGNRKILQGNADAQPITEVISSVNNLGSSEGSIQLEYSVEIIEPIALENNFTVSPQIMVIQIGLQY